MNYGIVSSSHITIDLVDEYKAVCYAVAEKEAREVGLENSQKRRFINSLCSDIHWRHVSNVPAQILFTAKTHKPQHEMKPRNVHGSQRGPFVPMKRYVCNKIQKHLSSLKHLCKDSIDLVKELKKHVFPAGSKFYKGDVEDFYMSGEHEGLKQDCQEVCPEEALEFILNTQYVTSGQYTAKVKCVASSSRWFSRQSLLCD